jgi:NAD(P)-dependent dehydrogenase (short-subunit alcohol dehydrogenase family)
MRFQDRVALVTGGGRGIGAATAQLLAAEGAKVAVSDMDIAPATEVAAPIHGIAIACDVTNRDQVEAMVARTVKEYGKLDILVACAGITRDNLLYKMTDEDWDAVIDTHLKGTFLSARAAQRQMVEQKYGKMVFLSSTSALGNRGQANYSAAKAGIAAFTLVAAAELGRYGVTVNAIAPSARTRMTETAFAEMMARPERGFDAMDPANIAPLVVWLGSGDSGDVTGRVFELAGGRVSVAQGWMQGPEIDRGDRWEPAELGRAVRELLERAAPPQPVYGG